MSCVSVNKQQQCSRQISRIAAYEVGVTNELLKIELVFVFSNNYFRVSSPAPSKYTHTMTRGVTRGTLAGSDLSLPGAGDWAEVGEVARLYVYPVKSMAGVR